MKDGYELRAESLAALRFTDYPCYLRSKLWRGIRAERLANRPICELCPAPAVEVHHLSYALPVMRGEDRHKLVCLCRACHHLIEHGRKGGKRPFDAALNASEKALRLAGRWDLHCDQWSGKLLVGPRPSSPSKPNHNNGLAPWEANKPQRRKPSKTAKRKKTAAEKKQARLKAQCEASRRYHAAMAEKWR